MEIYNKIGLLNNTAQKVTNQVLFSVLKTTIEMLKDRNYEHIQACQTIDEVVQNMNDNRFIVCGNGTQVVHVFFHNDERLGVKQLRSWVEQSAADNIIVVSLDGPTAFTRKEAENQFPHVQFFLFKDLCVNITRHCLVPKHEKIESTSDLPLPFTTSKNELPGLYTTDKVAQYYAYAPGDVIRITRTAGVQEPVYYYRMVRLPPNG